MKKAFALIMVLAMVLSMSIASYAASDDFLVSPSKKPAPELVDFENEDPSCDADIVIHSYTDRDKLPEDDKNELEDAYDSIVDAEDVNDLNEKLKGDDLAVSELFGIEVLDCDDHDKHGNFNIKIKTDSAKNFNSLLAFDGEKWILIEGATVSGDILSFSADLDGFSALAIVVNTNGDAPQTGDSFSWIYVILMVASAAGFTAVCISMRKKKN